MFDLFVPIKRRSVHSLNLVPILDMLTTIIFFLLFSLSFMEYNKLTVPPSRNVTVSKDVTPPPQQARMLWVTLPTEQKLIFSWYGDKAGTKVEKFSLDTEATVIAQKALSLAQEFKDQNQNEKTILIGLNSQQSYEKLILLMDAVKVSLPDISLLSYAQGDAALNTEAK